MNQFQALLAALYTRLLLGAEWLAGLLPEPARQHLDTVVATHRAHTMDQRAQAGNLISLVIGIAVAVIVAVGVAIPIVNDVIAQSNLTGLTALVVGFIPVMLAVLIFVATVGPIMRRSQ